MQQQLQNACNARLQRKQVVWSGRHLFGMVEIAGGAVVDCR